jgi:hypothetical protein
MPSRRRQQFRSAVRQLLVVETLEARAMLAGNVTASVTRGTLNIKGDVEANAIVISQTPSVSGGFTITSLADSNTTINGGTVAVNLTGVLRVSIKMEGGNDQVGIGNDVEFVHELFASLAEMEEEEIVEESSLLAVVDEEDTPSEEDPEITILNFFGGDDEEGFDIEDPDFTPQELVQLPTRVTGLTAIELGDGDDTLIVMLRSTNNLTVEGGKGSDTILSMITSVGNMSIDADPARGAGMGDDMVAVVLSTIRGDLAITTEAEDDGVLVLGTKVTNFGVNAGGPVSGQITDNDMVVISSLYAADNVGVQTEVGDDGIYVDDLIADNFRIASGEGDDEVEIIGSALVSLLIDTGAGEDWVSLNSGEDGFSPLVIRRNLGINTGADDDQVEIEGGLLGLYIGGAMDVRTGAGDDELLVYNVSVGKTAVIEMDAGNDAAIVDSLDVRTDLTISLSAGNDVLSVRNLSARRYGVRGGTGNDVIHDLGNHEDPFSWSQFEHDDNGQPG